MMDLQAIPLEVEGGAVVRACVVQDATGWRLAWAREGGLRKEAFGEPFAKAREACRAAAKINERGANA